MRLDFDTEKTSSPGPRSVTFSPASEINKTADSMLNVNIVSRIPLSSSVRRNCFSVASADGQGVSCTDILPFASDFLPGSHFGYAFEIERWPRVHQASFQTVRLLFHVRTVVHA